jgi:hypothetical protein
MNWPRIADWCAGLTITGLFALIVAGVAPQLELSAAGVALFGNDDRPMGDAYNATITAHGLLVPICWL